MFKLDLANSFLYSMCLVIIFGLCQQYSLGYFHSPVSSQACINEGLKGNRQIRIVKSMNLAKLTEILEWRRHFAILRSANAPLVMR